jgi:phosphoribosylamine--glycine ligase
MEDGALGDAGKTVLIEEFISGKEVSILAAVYCKDSDLKNACIVPLLSATDHKRLLDGGKGPNTGGMGAIAPAPVWTEALAADFESHILKPTLRGLIEEADTAAWEYQGFIFFGLMIRDGKCYCLEYNVRLGDPETQVVLPMMDSDLLDLCKAIMDGSLKKFPICWKQGACCSVVAAAAGYPGTPQKGDVIRIDSAKMEAAGAHVYFAGVGGSYEELLTSGGRVLAVSAQGGTLDDARARAYAGMDGISFNGMQYRKDIGAE